MAAPHQGLALCGHIDGIYRTFWLELGTNRIGSRPGRGIVLGERGISKRHARILVEPDRIVVEDLGSKNGTYVNDRRVERATILPGDSLCFGTVRLMLEALTSDRNLAVDLASASGPEATHDSLFGRAALSEDLSPLPALPSTSPLLAEADMLSIGLAPIEAFVAALPPTPDGDLTASLSALVTFLGVDGAAVVELPSGRAPVVIATCNLPPDAIVPALGDLRDGKNSRLLLRTVELENGAEALMAARKRRNVDDGTASGLAFVIWGQKPEPLPESFWTIGLDLVSRFSSLPTFEPRLETEVRIPEGYVRCTSPPMIHLFRQLGAVARSDLPVLVLGETGVGKEGIARIVHASSARCEESFVAVNCAAIPADLLETELFGIGKGVATGVDQRAGKFELAEGGTLFLDEIGEMSAGLQAKLLRALQEKEVTPVGGAPRPIDVRIVAATNIRLGTSMDDGSFRRDLYYRLAGSILRIPTLVERREDIPALVTAFAKRAVREAGISVRGLDHQAMKMLTDQPWPGNVRQLEHTVRRLVLLASHAQVIDRELVRMALDEEIGEGETPPLPTLDLEQLEKRAITEAMERSQGNQTRAAELLGITRTTLYRRLSRHGLAPDSSADESA